MGESRKMLFLGDFENSKKVVDYLPDIPKPYNILLSRFLYTYVDQIRDHDVVMVPHHGSDTNGNPNICLYDKVKPSYAIVSSALWGSYQHPKVETLLAICDEPALIQSLLDNNALGISQPVGWGLDAQQNNILQQLTNCGLEIHQTTKARREYVNPNTDDIELFMIVTKMSETAGAVVFSRPCTHPPTHPPHAHPVC